jgi:hypothetical protein
MAAMSRVRVPVAPRNIFTVTPNLYSTVSPLAFSNNGPCTDLLSMWGGAGRLLTQLIKLLETSDHMILVLLALLALLKLGIITEYSVESKQLFIYTL